jgi:hypothetical protein
MARARDPLGAVQARESLAGCHSLSMGARMGSTKARTFFSRILLVIVAGFLIFSALVIANFYLMPGKPWPLC